MRIFHHFPLLFFPTFVLTLLESQSDAGPGFFPLFSFSSPSPQTRRDHRRRRVVFWSFFSSPCPCRVWFPEMSLPFLFFFLWRHQSVTTATAPPSLFFLPLKSKLLFVCVRPPSPFLFFPLFPVTHRLAQEKNLAVAGPCPPLFPPFFSPPLVG